MNYTFCFSSILILFIFLFILFCNFIKNKCSQKKKIFYKYVYYWILIFFLSIY